MQRRDRHMIRALAGVALSLGAASAIVTACGGEDPAVSPEPPEAGTDASSPGTSARPIGDGGGPFLPADGGPLPRAGFTRAAVPCGVPGYPRPEDGGAGTILLHTGTRSTFVELARDGTRIVAREQSRWSLWDADTLLMIAEGLGDHVDLRKDRLFTSQGSSAKVYDANNAVQLASFTLPGANTAKLSSDGSYIWTSTASALTAVSLTGEILATHAGDYRSAMVWADPGELRVGRGPAGNDVIETIPISGAPATTSAGFEGTFKAWFTDGKRFLTTEAAEDGGTLDGGAPLDALVRIYAPDATVFATQATRYQASGGGFGEYFWVASPESPGGGTDIYRIGTPQPLLHSGTQKPTMVGAVLRTGNGFIRFEPTGPVAQSVVSPILSGSLFSEWTGDDQGGWVYGTLNGTLLRGKSSSNPTDIGVLGCGRVLSVAGSKAGTTVVVTSAGDVFVYDLSQAQPAYERDLDFITARASLSDDGKLLATSNAGIGFFSVLDHDDRFNDTSDRTLRIVSPETGQALAVFPSTNVDPQLAEFAFAKGGGAVGRVARTYVDGGFVYDRVVTATTGGPDLFRDSVSGPRRTGGQTTSYAPNLALSPSGARIAAPSGAFYTSPGGTSTLYQGSVELATIPGFAFVWMDEDHVLTQTFVFGDAGRSPGKVSLYTAQGQHVRDMQSFSIEPYPSEHFVVLDPTHLLYRGRILDVSKGTTSSAAGTAASAGKGVGYDGEHFVTARPL